MQHGQLTECGTKIWKHVATARPSLDGTDPNTAQQKTTRIPVAKQKAQPLANKERKWIGLSDLAHTQK